MNYFLAVARTGNITQAAKELHITQPTLSRQITELEQELAVQLFDRSIKRHFTLTPAGIAFEEKARQLLQLWNQTKTDLQNQADIAGNIRIGLVESNIRSFICQAIQEFAQEYPVTFEIFSSDGDTLKAKLDNDELDLAIVINPIEIAKYNYVDLAHPETWGIFMSKSSPLASFDEISSEQLKHLPLFVPKRSIVQNNFSSINFKDLHLVGSVNLASNIVPLIETGKYYELAIAGIHDINHQDLIFKPLIPKTTSTHSLIYQKNHRLANQVSEFISFITKKHDQS
ncbi:MAG: LysR family transcriptional regulator [Lactobacillus sp.]|nr:LysR family transcriptional regulator [Lactobacillus sp.]